MLGNAFSVIGGDILRGATCVRMSRAPQTQNLRRKKSSCVCGCARMWCQNCSLKISGRSFIFSCYNHLCIGFLNIDVPETLPDKDSDRREENCCARVSTFLYFILDACIALFCLYSLPNMNI